METTFENARAGDRVWSVGYGWGTVESVSKGVYPVVVSFDCGIDVTYTFSGMPRSSGLQTLFWDEVKIEAPPRPRRKVMKTIDGWANVYPNERPMLHDSKEEADKAATFNRIACVKLTGEYTVEE
jgi:hypothetical protein